MPIFASLAAIYAVYILVSYSRLPLSNEERKSFQFGRMTSGIVAGLVFANAAYFLINADRLFYDNDATRQLLQQSNIAVQTFLLAIATYAVLRRFTVLSNIFFSSAISSVLAYFLVSAGFFFALVSVFDVGFAAIVDFFDYLLLLPKVITRPWFVSQFLVHSTASTIFLIVAFGTHTNEAQRIQLSQGGQSVAFKNSSNEPLRLVAGLAACGRLPGQSALEDEINHPAQAVPYPIDIDRDVIQGIVKARREQNIKRNIFYTIFAVVGFFITVGTETPIGIVLAIFASAILYFRTLQNDKYSIAPSYKPESFDEGKLHSQTGNDQNLVVYAGDNPFVAFGATFGNWILSVDKKRAKPVDGLAGKTSSISDPNIDEIRQKICTSLKGSGLEEKYIRTLYFSQGKNVPYQVKQPGPHKPPRRVHQQQLDDLLTQPDTPVREYLWLRKPGWGREISTSYFLRLIEDRDDINLEITAVLMPPISDSHRWVDKIPPSGFRQYIGDFVVSIFGGMALMIWSPIYLFFLMQVGFAKIFTNPEKAIKKAIEQQPDYDFGAPIGLRRQLSDFGAISYFQNSDRRMAETAFTGRILRVFIDALDAYNIDTSELREQRTTLLNQGIIVQGGDLKAKNVAAGLGSRINSVTSRITGSAKGGSPE